MDHLTELFRSTERDAADRPAAVKGIINGDPATDAERVYVLVPAFDGGEHQHGPCPWTPRGSARPSTGDDALVVFDEQGDPWVVAWWPSS